MPQPAFDDFVIALKAGITGESTMSVVEELGKKFPSLKDQTTLPGILRAVRSLQTVYRDGHIDAQTFPADIAEALDHDAHRLSKDIDLKQLEERIRQVVSGRRISVESENVRSLRGEIERGYCKGRIVTDLRAVFSDDASVSPAAMTIMHTLRIRYHDDVRRHREFYVAMDGDDLADLKTAIERAQQKSKTLQDFLSKSNCRILE